MNANTIVKIDSFSRNVSQPEFATANDIVSRYRITKMTLWRWINNENVNFPRPIYINTRRYFRISDVLNWEAERNNGGAH